MKLEIESVCFRCTHGKSRTGWIYTGEFKCNLLRHWRFTAWNVPFKGSQSCLEQRNGTSSSITVSVFTILTSQQHTLQWSEIHQKYDISISLTFMIKSRWSPSKHSPKRSLLHKKTLAARSTEARPISTFIKHDTTRISLECPSHFLTRQNTSQDCYSKMKMIHGSKYSIKIKAGASKEKSHFLR